MASCRFQHLCDDGAELPPGRGPGVQLRASSARQLVVLRAAVVVGGGLPGLDPASPLEAVQRWVERSLAHCQDGARYLVQPLRNRAAVLRLERDGLEDEEVERPLRQVQAVGHGAPFVLRQESNELLVEAQGEWSVSTSDTASGERCARTLDFGAPSHSFNSHSID